MSYATRRAALDQVLAELERDGTTGPDVALPRAFADTGELLATAHQRWHSHLGARIDAALESGEPPAVAVGDAYRQAVAAMPGLRRLLDSHAGHPALARAEERELSLLAWAAGLTSGGTPAARAAALGREFRDLVGAGVPTTPEPATPEPASRRVVAGRVVAGRGATRSWLRRLRNAVAA